MEVIRHLGAAQAQDFGVAKWSLAQRAGDLTNSAVEQAFSDGSIVRTHILRPTWHFVLPTDVRWMLELTGPRVNARNTPRYRQLGLDDELFASTNELFAEALKGRRHLTRKELAGVLDRAGISTDGQRMAYILMRAELDAVLCSGPRKGKLQTYALFDERVPTRRTMDRDAALAELTRRYFGARGPATVKDLVWWSSLTSRDARLGIEAIQSELDSETVDGRVYWFAKETRRTAPRSSTGSRGIDLVQGLDECIVSYRESKDVLFPSAATTPIPLQDIVFNHVVLLDGQLIGQWRPVQRKGSILVETLLYRRLSRRETGALEAAIEKYSRFMEMPATQQLRGGKSRSLRTVSPRVR